MKNLTIFILVIIFFVISIIFSEKKETHKVIKILSPTELYIDFNDNNIADEDELITLYHLESLNERLNEKDLACLNYLGKNYATRILLNKEVKIQKNSGNELSVVVQNGSIEKDYTQLLEKNGYIITQNNQSKVNQVLLEAKKLHLVSYNTHSHKYHTLDCKYAFKSPNIEILETKNLPKDAKPCHICHTNKNTKNKIKQNTPKAGNYSSAYKDNVLEFYITDFIKNNYPSSKCSTQPCKILLKEINSAKETINFAIYGIDKQPEITNALINAQKRGVKIRWIFDTDKNGESIYKETLSLKNVLKNFKRDIDINSDNLINNGKTYKDAIMHNKFFIFDNKKVWTGSANISYTDLSGFNANGILLINSPEIAQIYTKEFEQMYSGKFHNFKSITQENSIVAGNSIISVYFSPQDKIITNKIIKYIDKAEKYIYIPVFVITHKEFNKSLIRAKNRGVDVKIIIDATSAGNKYSTVKFLRENNIPVKVENRAGKMHMKSIIIDDRYTITGSMNFTQSGEKYNDENVLIIKNQNLTKYMKNQFMDFWNSIPDKWLYKNPRAESLSSINSCFDGVDNDFDGKIDMNDDSCNYKLKIKTKVTH